MFSEVVFSDVVCLDEGDPELRRAWNTFPDPVMEHQGEGWQYMATRQREGVWQHCFRHRYHPQTKTRTNAEVNAAPGWEPAPS